MHAQRRTYADGARPCNRWCRCDRHRSCKPSCGRGGWGARGESLRFFQKPLLITSYKILKSVVHSLLLSLFVIFFKNPSFLFEKVVFFSTFPYLFSCKYIFYQCFSRFRTAPTFSKNNIFSGQMVS